MKVFDCEKKVIKEVTNLLSLNRYVSVRPAWIYNPEIANYEKKYIVDEDYVYQRDVQEIIGDKTLDDLREEIIDIQRQHMYQSYVVSELAKRYSATPDEVNTMLKKTDTQVPKYYKSLYDYKMSGNWIGEPKSEK